MGGDDAGDLLGIEELIAGRIRRRCKYLVKAVGHFER
jgi:hypothetical protein